MASPGVEAGRGGCRAIALGATAPGRCPSMPWPPGPGQSRALRAWCPTPGDGGPSRQRPARETRPRAAPFTACAGRWLSRGRAGSAAPANPAGSPASLGRDGQRVSCWCCHASAPGCTGRRGSSQRPAAGVKLPGDGLAIPRRALLGAPWLAGQGLRPDRQWRQWPVDRLRVLRVWVRGVQASSIGWRTCNLRNFHCSLSGLGWQSVVRCDVWPLVRDGTSLVRMWGCLMASRLTGGIFGEVWVSPWRAGLLCCASSRR